MKLFNKSKKAQINDVVILGAIFFIFVGIGVFLPFLQVEYQVTGNATVNAVNTTVIDPNTFNDVTPLTANISILGIVFSVIKMFFWTFGDLPLWLDSIFVVIRITFAVLIYRLIRNGGG